MAVVKIPLANVEEFALIDRSDLELVQDYQWKKYGHGYATTHRDGRSLYMHRLIMGEPKGLEVDHINRDQLDNRRANLRAVTHAQNLQNRDVRGYGKTGVRGVTLYRGRFRARVWHMGVEHAGGVFDTLEEATQAVSELRLRLHPFGVEAQR